MTSNRSRITTRTFTVTAGLATVALALALALALSGCGVIGAVRGVLESRSPGAAGAAASAPHVGNCWLATNEQASDWAVWGGGASVDCRASHTLITVAVVRLPQTAPDDWAETAPPHDVRPEVWTGLGTKCGDAVARAIGGRAAQLVTWFTFLPSRSAWRAGQHWVRCDLGLLAHGSLLTALALADLPATTARLAADIKNAPARYAYCLDTGPTDARARRAPDEVPSATLADCSGHPLWRVLSRSLGEPKDRFPGTARVRSLAFSRCGMTHGRNPDDWASLPDKARWAGGDRTVTCFHRTRGSG